MTIYSRKDQEFIKNIGDQITIAREKLGMTQRQLARAIGGIQPSTISKMERGEYLVDNAWPRIAKVCKELGIENVYIREIDKERKEKRKADIRIIIEHKYALMNETQKEIDEYEKMLESL